MSEKELFTPEANPELDNLKSLSNPEFSVVFLKSLREGLDDKDSAKLRVVLDEFVRRMAEGGDVSVAEISDAELKDLLELGELTIYVGIGTNGQKVYVADGNNIYMPIKDDSLGYGVIFREIFGGDSTDMWPGAKF